MKRLTNRELSKWLAQGNGQVKEEGMIFTTVSYYEGSQDNEVRVYIKVRKWGDEEWHEPTYEYCFETEEKTENRAEWHYVKDNDFPEEGKEIWICYIDDDGDKQFVYGWQEYDGAIREFFTSDPFLSADIRLKNVYAWIETIPPRDE